jgi:DNA polymerase-3 subunit gamma/tau
MANYNKYKPKKFNELYGVDVNLFKAICDNPDSGNAIILCGPHGTGKTVLAHIYSKYINCLSDKNKPCYECEACTANHEFDLVETDGAINNGVDYIRELKEQAYYAPISFKYKLFIIDEVHMLSRSALDALLILLHNPPTFSKFIFATTQLEKLPDTFVSRCVVFRLSRLNRQHIKTILNDICLKENTKIPGEIINEIAILSEGSARSAISMLEPLMLGAETLTIDSAYKQLGIVNHSTCFRLFDICLSGNLKEAISIWREYYNNGYSEKAFLHAFLNVLENIFLAKGDIPFEFIDDYKMLLTKYNITYNFLFGVWDIFCESLRNAYQNDKACVEIALHAITVLDDESTKICLDFSVPRS